MKVKKYLFLIYLFIYSAFFLFLSKGFGNYWDSTFPYFSDQVKNVSLYLNSWNEVGLGSPLGYESNYYLMHLISGLHILSLNPEILRYSLFVVTLATISYGVYTFIDRRKTGLWPFVFGLVFVFSPVIFYKIFAGHFTYLVSLAIFIWFLNFLFYRFKADTSSYLYLSLYLAFVGFQIQFFIFSAVVLVFYFILNKRMFDWKKLLMMVAVVFLVNLPWLSNYIVGASSLASASSQAGSVSFIGSEKSSLARIFFMVFSNATNIQYVYDRWAIVFNGIFSTLLCLLIGYFYLIKRRCAEKLSQFIIRDKKSQDKKLFVIADSKDIDLLVLILLFFVVLGTGFFQNYNVPVIKFLYPMFREIGHFAPIIFLFEILLFSELIGRTILPKKTIAAVMLTYLVCFIFLNAWYFQRYIPVVNYQQARSELQKFNDFGKTDSSAYRVLTYPFWNQYGFNSRIDTVKNGKLLNNSGWDSFIEFSGKDHISNYAPGGQSVVDTLQYRLMKTFDVSELEKDNVKYIYNLSGIYSSNFDKYTPSDSYQNDLSIVKNQKDFFNKLIANNPLSVKLINANILELLNYLPRVQSANIYFKKDSPFKYELLIKNIKPEQELIFSESYNKNWHLYPDIARAKSKQNVLCVDSTDFKLSDTHECSQPTKKDKNILEDFLYLSKKPIFESTHVLTDEATNKWKIGSSGTNSDYFIVNPDGTKDLPLVLYFYPQSAFALSVLASIVSLLGIGVSLLFMRNKPHRRK
ncbi:MAG: hypothetical protein WCI57_03180 [Candidatus Berkelbacteria bacterium]